MVEPIKRATTVDEQIARLRDCGMTVDDALAHQWLPHVQYYRLAGYWYPYRQQQPYGRRGDAFLPGTNFADVTALYEFDRKLRSLTLDALERVEVALRAHISALLGLRDPLSYLDESHFRSTFDHARWVATAKRRVSRAQKNSPFVQHNLAKYGPDLPIWVLVQVLDFSDLSIMFEGLRTQDQFTVAEGLGLQLELNSLSKSQQRKAKQSHPLTVWLEQLSIIRNTCAHHGRLWNASFIPASGVALHGQQTLRLMPDKSLHVYGAFLLIAHLLQTISPGTSWPSKVRALVTGSFIPISGRNVQEMGFPSDWHQDPLWASSRDTPTKGSRHE